MIQGIQEFNEQKGVEIAAIEGMQERMIAVLKAVFTLGLAGLGMRRRGR